MKLQGFPSPRQCISQIRHRRYFRARKKLLSSCIDAVAANHYMTSLLEASSPCLIGRIGGTECVICWHHLQRSAFLLGLNSGYPRHIAHMAHELSGIVPTDDRSLDRFSSIYLAAVTQADLLGLWDVRGMYETRETKS